MTRHTRGSARTSAAAASAEPAAAPERTKPAEPRGNRTPDAERLAFSIEEAARLTGLSRDLLYDQMRTGKLAYIKVGRRRIITRRHLEEFLRNGAA